MHVGTDLLAEIGNLIDKGDFSRNAFAAYLVSSAVSRLVNRIGVSIRNRGR
jgi:hypothetical protein